MTLHPGRSEGSPVRIHNHGKAKRRRSTTNLVRMTGDVCLNPVGPIDCVLGSNWVYLVGLESRIHEHVEILKMDIDFKCQIKNNLNLVFFYLHFKYCAVSMVMEVQLLHWQRKATKMELWSRCSGRYIFWISSFHPHSVPLSALRSRAFISATTSKESSITSATL